MTPPLVSVILTSYNHAAYVGDAIRSVLDQTFEDFELIVVDDCSSDDSVAIIRTFDDPRLQLFVNPQRARAVHGINRSITERARGELIAIHHCDDLWHPRKLEKQVALLRHRTDIAAVFTHVEPIDEHGEPVPEEETDLRSRFAAPNRSRFEWLGHFARRGNALCHPSVLIRKRVYEDVGLYDYGLEQLGDFNQWIKVCLKYEIHVLPEPLVSFRTVRHRSSVSADRLDTHSRGAIERLHLFRHYLHIQDSTQVARVFDLPPLDPSTKEPWVIRYLVGHSFMTQGSNPEHRLFALLVLLELIGEKDHREAIADRFGFTHQDLLDWTGRWDLFGIFTSRYLKLPPTAIVELFFDRGNGYRAEDRERQSFQGRTAIHEFSWKPALNLVELRFDPINIPAAVRLVEVSSELEDGRRLVLRRHNGLPVGHDRYLFNTEDPRFFFGVEEGDRPFRLRRIRFRVEYPAMLHELVDDYQRLGQRAQDDARRLESLYRPLKAENAALRSRLAEIERRPHNRLLRLLRDPRSIPSKIRQRLKRS